MCFPHGVAQQLIDDVHVFGMLEPGQLAFDRGLNAVFVHLSPGLSNYDCHDRFVKLGVLYKLRPRSGFMFVFTEVSSINTKRRGSRSMVGRPATRVASYAVLGTKTANCARREIPWQRPRPGLHWSDAVLTTRTIQHCTDPSSAEYCLCVVREYL